MAVEYKKVIVVNDHDEILGVEDMLTARERGQIRRASRVFVFNERGEVLVQRRSAAVLQPLLLDQSVGGHVDDGETYAEAAKREMREELGLAAVPLTEVVVSYRTPSHFNGIYHATISSEQPIHFDHEEVAEVIWFEPAALSVRMEAHPEQFTGSFPTVWFEFRDTLLAL